MSPIETLLAFVHPDCPHSAALLEDFRSRKVVYREINLKENAAGLVRLQEFYWERRLPVVLDHERLSIGFRGQSSTFEELGLDC